jgi:hypothetical protein
MRIRAWPDLRQSTVALDEIQHRISICGKFLRQRLPEILIAISVVGLAYETWSAWRH